MNLTPWRRHETRSVGRHVSDPFAALQREMNQLLEGFLDDGPQTVFRGTTMLLAPKLDVSETEKEWHIAVELPGVKETDVDIEFSGDTLRIRGQKTDERDEKQHNFHRLERSFGMFERIIPLPAEVDRQNVQATFKNGVLQITLPKSVEARATQKIPVKPGG